MLFEKDFREFCALLNEERIDYLIVGGYAVAFHGARRATGDIDASWLCSVFYALLALFLLPRHVPDRALSWLGWRFHELLQDVEHHLKALVVLLLHRVEPFGEFLVGREDLAETDERAHDGYVHCDPAFAV